MYPKPNDAEVESVDSSPPVEEKPAASGPKPLDVLPNVTPPHRNPSTNRQLLAVAAVVILAMIAISVFMLLRNSS